tara:strand:+ start:1828 stop:2349 length:522 start_codon:yes stop_codon:yes gene_type:complete
MATKFLSDLESKIWKSSKSNTVSNPEYNKYPVGDWRLGLVEDKDSYYPPEGVEINIVSFPLVRDAYSVDSNGASVQVPRMEQEAFHMVVTGDDFKGKEALQTARFIVYCDHAVSNPVKVNIDLYVVIHVRLRMLDSGRLVMVNELIWSVEEKDRLPGNTKFYDIQKWYCCGYP